MPTATTTVSKRLVSKHITLKAAVMAAPSLETSSPPPNTPTNATTIAATLRSLYPRATRAFLHRDISLTCSLIQSAFSLLKPPSLVPDPLTEFSRKWDILRITLETTVYASPPPSHKALPEPLCANIVQSPQALISASYSRSLTLFTPTSQSTPNAAYLPSQVLITLLCSSLKTDCPDVGRVMVEDWLACREPHYLSNKCSNAEPDDDGYEKVLDLYCLHILPKLEQWDYAKEYLQYEGELPVDRREYLRNSLNTLYNQTMESRRPRSLPSASSSASPCRPYSPTPSSSSSSSSSLSTTSTHTVVPRANGLTSLTQASLSSTSLSSDTTATPRSSQLPRIPNGRSTLKSRTSSASNSHSSTVSSIPRAHVRSIVRPPSPTTYAVIKASLAPYFTTSELTTFLILFVLFPLISFLLRIRHRRRQQLLLGGKGQASNVDLVRRRLQAGGASEAGIIARAWSEIVRSIGDTVKMAGSGLV